MGTSELDKNRWFCTDCDWSGTDPEWNETGMYFQCPDCQSPVQVMG